MTRRHDAKRSNRPQRPGLVVPGRWQQTDQTLKDPGAGFMEVAMVTLQSPELPGGGMPGHMSQMLWFHEVGSDEACPCGSGSPFVRCHRNTRRVPILCRDLDAETYSELLACETSFAVHDTPAVRRLLKAAPELQVTQDIPGRTFWQFLGHPRLKTPIGAMIFATVELNPHRLYFVTLSRRRNEAIIASLISHIGEHLGQPIVQESEIEAQYRGQLVR